MGPDDIQSLLQEVYNKANINTFPPLVPAAVCANGNEAYEEQRYSMAQERCSPQAREQGYKVPGPYPSSMAFLVSPSP